MAGFPWYAVAIYFDSYTTALAVAAFRESYNTIESVSEKKVKLTDLGWLNWQKTSLNQQLNDKNGDSIVSIWADKEAND